TFRGAERHRAAGRHHRARPSRDVGSATGAGRDRRADSLRIDGVSGALRTGMATRGSKAKAKARPRRNPRNKSKRGPVARVLRWIFLAILAFIGVSLLQVLIYKVVPVPVTLTMLFDKNGITKDWTPLS